MVKLTIRRKELQQLILWGAAYRDSSRSLKVPFEPDEEELLQKLKDALDKKLGGEGEE